MPPLLQGAQCRPTVGTSSDFQDVVTYLFIGLANMPIIGTPDVEEALNGTYIFLMFRTCDLSLVAYWRKNMLI